MAPYKALYDGRCRFPIAWFEVGEAGFRGLKNIGHKAMEKLKFIQEWLKIAK